MSLKVSMSLFQNVKYGNWPIVNTNLLVETDLNLPIQIKGKLVTTIKTKKGYNEKEILKLIYEIDKVKNKMINKEVIKIINVQDKIINIITN